jgi:hypothetical protein
MNRPKGEPISHKDGYRDVPLRGYLFLTNIL